MKTATFLGRHQAFGWALTHMGLAAGAAYSYILSRDTPREQLPAVSLWTKGRVSGVNKTTGAAVDDRVPGVLTSDLARVVRAGRFVLTAQEDSEWWCVSAKLNGGQLPELDVYAIPAGTSIQLPANTRALLCSGSVVVNDGNTLVPGATLFDNVSLTLRAPSDTLLLTFDRELP